MNKYLSVVAWSVFSVLGVHGVWAGNAHYFDLQEALQLSLRPEQPSLLNHPSLEIIENEMFDVLVVEEASLFVPAFLQEEGLWGARIQAFWQYASELRYFPGWPSVGYLQVGRAGELYAIQLLLETIERYYPDLGVLSEVQRSALAAIYSELAEIMLLVSVDATLVNEEERYHLVDLLGLLLRAPGAPFKARSIAHHLALQYYLEENQDYRIESYIDIWARALRSGQLPSHYISEIGRALLDCTNQGVADRVQQAAARAMGALLGHADLDTSFQAECVKCWLDLVFKRRCGPRMLQAVVQGMQVALRGAYLNEEIRLILFDALLQMHDSCGSFGFCFASQQHWLTEALLTLWAEGLRSDWFDADQVRRLVPVVMEYRAVVRCPLRTQAVVRGLVGLLHARAEDSTFRQLVYQHLGDILLADEQRDVVVGVGVEQLGELFMLEALPTWERTKIIAFLGALLHQCQSYHVSIRFFDALQNIVGCPLLSDWERRSVLNMIQHLCVHHGDVIDMRVEELRASLGFLKEHVSVSDMELIDQIIETLPEDDDDLDSEDDDLD